MDFGDFVVALLDICFLPFSWTDNIIVFVPTFVLFFCGCFALVKRLMFRR